MKWRFDPLNRLEEIRDLFAVCEGCGKHIKNRCGHDDCDGRYWIPSKSLIRKAEGLVKEFQRHRR